MSEEPNTAQYIDITTDFGFKRFMREDHLLIGFLNSVLHPSDPIAEIAFKAQIVPRSQPSSPTQEKESSRPRASTSAAASHLPITDIVRIHEEEFGEDLANKQKAVRYDIVCITKTGAYVNIEMQKAKQEYYYDRALFYSARLLSRQGYKGDNNQATDLNKFFPQPKRQKGVWNFELNPSYHIGILDFDITGGIVSGVPTELEDCWLIWSSMMFDGRNSLPISENLIASDLLKICLISLKNFERAVGLDQELDKSLEKFVWIMSNFGRGTAKKLPSWMKDFSHLHNFELEKLSPDERKEYELDKEIESDRLHELQLHRTQGREEGRAQGREEGWAEATVALYLAMAKTEGEAAAMKSVETYFGEQGKFAVVQYLAKLK